MTRRLRPSSIAALAATAMLALSILAVGLISSPNPAAAKPQADDLTNGCTSIVTQTANPDTVRICDPSELEVAAAPSCPTCPGGLKVVFIQREEATEARWQNKEAIAALDQLEKIYDGDNLQVAVVHYGSRGARAVARMGSRLSSARGMLNRPKTVANPDDANGMADEAAREAVRQMQPGRDEDDTLKTCKLVLFFAQDSPTPG